MSGIDAIIFDFDGVIIESEGIKARAFARLFGGHPDLIEQIVEFHLRHGGLSRYEKFEFIYRELLRQPLTAEKKAELGRQFSSIIFREVVNCPFVPGALEFLEKYHSRCRLFLVSATPEEEVRKIVRERKLDSYFVEVHGSPVKKAVHNQMLLGKYGLKKERTVYVGDSIDDWEGANEAGISFIGRIVAGNDFHGLKTAAVINDLDGLDELVMKGVI